MEFQQVLEHRYSCRNFLQKPVPRSAMVQLMQGAKLAPSACNSQRWVFLGVDDPATVRKLGTALVDEELQINLFAEQIPAFIALVYHPMRNPSSRQHQILGEELQDWAEFDLGMAAQNICLAATNLGLGTCVMGHFPQEKVQEILGVPPEQKVVVCIAVGYPAEEKERKPIRLGSEEVFRFNHYDNGK